jgi:phosphatidylethanolamine/phosphatidyl-N-methylethanolamine N-methyltransferase
LKPSMELFFDQFKKNFHHTGALAPSSRSLARAITSQLIEANSPCRILEAGPGTGVITAAIAARMSPFDTLDIYEINPVFADYLEKRLETEACFAALAGRIKVHREDILALPDEAVYDRIISSIPMNNFEPEWVKELMTAFMAHLSPGGILSYFEYALVSRLKRVVSPRNERMRLRGVSDVTAEFVQRYQLRADHVLLNLPPAVTHHLVSPVAARRLATSGARALRPAAAVR